jgi:hypothetical protein
VLAAIKALCHPCWFSWRVSFGLEWLAVFTHLYHHTQSLDFMGFNGLEALCVTAHCSLRYWVVFATNGRAVGYIASSRPCFHLSVVVGWLESHEGYTLCVLSIITKPKWSLAPLFIASPVTGFVTLSTK